MSIKDEYWSLISRNTDPQTSKEAETLYTLTSRQKRLREVLELVRDYPGHTAGELGRKMHEKYPDRPIVATSSTPHKRMSELWERGLVKYSHSRECTDSGYLADVVYITEKGERELER